MKTLAIVAFFTAFTIEAFLAMRQYYTLQLPNGWLRSWRDSLYKFADRHASQEIQKLKSKIADRAQEKISRSL